MSYASLSDVQALNPKRTYDATTTPTSTQVSSLITQVAAEIDMVLASQGYTVPVTAPASLLTALKYINAYGAGALAEAGMFPEVAGLGETPHWKMLETKYQDWLKSLREGKIPPDLDKSADTISSFYHVMSDQEDFPDPIFRIRSEDKDF